MDKRLLILGAGGHGQVVYEIAVDCGYQQIDYLDDKSDVAVGKINELEKFIGEYDEVIPGIGNNHLREELIRKAKNIGFEIAVLVHPTSYVSRTAILHIGTVVEPKAIVNAHTIIGAGTIISVGAIVDHNVVVEQCCHINTGAIIKAGAIIPAYQKLEAGEIVLGYKVAIVNKEEEDL